MILTHAVYRTNIWCICAFTTDQLIPELENAIEHVVRVPRRIVLLPNAIVSQPLTDQTGVKFWYVFHKTDDWRRKEKQTDKYFSNDWAYICLISSGYLWLLEVANKSMT